MPNECRDEVVGFNSEEIIQMEPRAPGVEATLQLYDRYAEQIRNFQVYANESGFQTSATTSTTLLMR